MVEEDVVRTSVYLPRVLYEKARALGINISEVTRLALIAEIQLREEHFEEFKERYALLRLRGRGTKNDLSLFDGEEEWDDDSSGRDEAFSVQDEAFRPNGMMNLRPIDTKSAVSGLFTPNRKKSGWDDESGAP